MGRPVLFVLVGFLEAGLDLCVQTVSCGAASLLMVSSLSLIGSTCECCSSSCFGSNRRNCVPIGFENLQLALHSFDDMSQCAAADSQRAPRVQGRGESIQRVDHCANTPSLWCEKLPLIAFKQAPTLGKLF